MIGRSMLLAVVVFLGSLAIGVARAAAFDIIVGGPPHTDIRIWHDAGSLWFCDINVNTNTGFAYIYPPDGYSSYWAFWRARIWHTPSNSNTPTYSEWTDEFYYNPTLPNGTGYGAWYALNNTSANFTVVNAFPLGRVGIEVWLWDELLWRNGVNNGWMLQGGAYARSCQVTNTD